METRERIEVYADIQNGKTVCICPRCDKRCEKPCEPEVVERDRYDGWEKTFARDRYGR